MIGRLVFLIVSDIHHTFASMKTNDIILITLCTFFLNMPVYAQFNTVGTYNHKRIKTNHPPKPITPVDSTTLADSVAEPPVENWDNHLTDNPVQNNMSVAPLAVLPLKSIHIGSRFGMRMHPIYHRRIMHNGIDLSARYEKVYSMFPGTVINVGQDSRSGKFVTVRTGNYTISYCHLSQQLVKNKDFVNAGSNIAISGNTGASTGPHLHITAKKDGKAFDPTILLEYVRSIKKSCMMQPQRQ